MAIHTHFTRENDSHFFVNPPSRTPIPTRFFKIFYDAILNQLAENNCLTEIKPEIVKICKKEVGNEFSGVDETVNLLFYLTLQLRRNLADELLHRPNYNYTFDEFEIAYRLKLAQHCLPFPEHDIFDSKKVLQYLGEPDFVENIEIAAMKEWEQQNPEIANSELLYKRPRDTPQYLILQQIIQYYMKIEIQTQNKVDVSSVRIKTCAHIQTNDFLNKIPNVLGQIMRRIGETKKIMLPPRSENRADKIRTAENRVLIKRNLDTTKASLPEREKKRVHLEPIYFNHEEGVQLRNGALASEAFPPLPVMPASCNQSMPSNDHNIVPPIKTKLDPAQFIESHFNELKRLGMSAGRLHIYQKFTAEWGGNCDAYFSMALRDKFREVVQGEIAISYPHLLNVAPVIERKSYKELDVFLQKMIQWELTQNQHQRHSVIIGKIMTAMENSSLPYLSIFSKVSIRSRIKETEEYYKSHP